MSRVVELSKIRIDGGTQPREAIDQKTVDEYAESYAALVKMPPVVVYFDGVDAWLADGFHRYHAAKKSGVQAIDADWREGTLEMAKFYAAGANVGHGLRRKDADKKRAILMLLETAQGKKWASEKGSKGSGATAIAKHCGVSIKWATDVMATLSTSNLPTRAEKRAKVERALAEKPGASAREIAAEAGVSHTTVENIREEKARCAARRDALDPAPATEQQQPKPEPIVEMPDDPFHGCGNGTRRDAVNAWAEQGEMIFKTLSEEGRTYMLNQWAKRVKKLEGYAA